MIDRDHRVRSGQLTGRLRRPEERHLSLATPGPGQFSGLAQQLIGGVLDLAACLLSEHEDVVAHVSHPFTRPRERSNSMILSATWPVPPASISACPACLGVYMRRTVRAGSGLP